MKLLIGDLRCSDLVRLHYWGHSMYIIDQLSHCCYVFSKSRLLCCTIFFFSLLLPSSGDRSLLIFSYRMLQPNSTMMLVWKSSGVCIIELELFCLGQKIQRKMLQTCLSSSTFTLPLLPDSPTKRRSEFLKNFLYANNLQLSFVMPRDESSSARRRLSLLFSHLSL